MEFEREYRERCAKRGLAVAFCAETGVEVEVLESGLSGDGRCRSAMTIPRRARALRTERASPFPRTRFRA